MLLSTLLFIISILFTIYLPGRFLLRKTEFVQKSLLSTVTLSLGFGICFYIFIQYLFSWIHLASISNILFIVIGIFESKNSLKEIREIKLSSLLSVESLIVLTGTILMSVQIITSGILINGSMFFYADNSVDSIYHIAIIQNMMHYFPPQNPSISGIPLRGYHFLYDFLITQIALLTHIPVLDLFFRFFTIGISLFYGLSGWVFADFLKMDKKTKQIFLFLLYFAQGLEFFYLYPFGNREKFYDTGVIQSFVNIFNPSVVISVGLFFLFFILFFSIKKRKQILLPTIILGVLTSIKIYTAMLAYSAALPISIYFLFRKKMNFLLIVLCSLLVSSIVYIPFNLKAGSLIFAPLLLYRHFIEGSIAFSDFHWGLQYDIFAQHHNFPHIIYLYAVAIFLFFIPSLGIRLIGIVELPKVLKKTWYSDKKIFLSIFIALGFFLASFFIQSIGIFNTVQFLWLVYIVLCIPTAFILGKIISKNSLLTVVIPMVLIISVLPDITLSLRSTFQSPLILNNDFLTFTQKVKSSVPREDAIMVINRENGNDVYGSMRFAAFTDRSIYYEPEVTDFANTSRIIPQRRAAVDEIQASIKRCNTETASYVRNLLEKSGIRYIIFLKPICKLDQNQLKKVQGKGPYSLYKI